MKKFLVVLACVLCFPVITFAKVNVNNYETSNLSDALKAEEIKADLSNYKESNDQVTIYMFRGQGCTHCRAFLTFLSKLDEEELNKIKLVSFEVWSNKDNETLASELAKFLGQSFDGVPLIIIGDQVFSGYAETYDDGIKAAIDEQYNADKKYDVISEYNKANKSDMKNSTLFVFDLLFTAVAAGLVIFFNDRNTKKMLLAINKSEKKVEVHNEPKKEVKKTKKK